MSRSVQIRIPRPCHENWENMTAQERGRFCGVCQTTVVDFSKMTDKEMLDYFSNTGQKICGRFSGNQLNREITIPRNNWRFSWTYIWKLLLATVLLTESCTEEVQGKVIVDEEPTAILQQEELEGYILDSTSGAPVAGASIRMVDYGRVVLTDSTGRFTLIAQSGDSVKLEISANRFKTKEALIDSNFNRQHIKLMMTKVH